MTDQFGTDGVLRLIGEARQAVESMRGAHPVDPDLVRGTGSAADGLVVATVGAPNRVDSLHLNPRAMRLASEQLAEQVLAAINAAFADFADRARDQAPDVGVDPGALAGRLRALQEESMRSMESFSQAMVEAFDRVRRAGG